MCLTYVTSPLDPPTPTHIPHTHIDHSPVVPKRSPTDKMSPMRLVNWAKGGGAKGDEVLAEINRKMQRALEEALMKNIHLHEVSTVWVCALAYA